MLDRLSVTESAQRRGRTLESRSLTKNDASEGGKVNFLVKHNFVGDEKKAVEFGFGNLIRLSSSGKLFVYF